MLAWRTAGLSVLARIHGDPSILQAGFVSNREMGRCSLVSTRMSKLHSMLKLRIVRLPVARHPLALGTWTGGCQWMPPTAARSRRLRAAALRVRPVEGDVFHRGAPLVCHLDGHLGPRTMDPRGRRVERDGRLADRAWLRGDAYTIAGIAAFPWVRNLIGFHVARMLDAFLTRPAVVRGLEIPRRS